MIRMILDDVRNFPEEDDWDLIVSRTSKAAIVILSSLQEGRVKLNELWLDHDLGWDPDAPAGSGEMFDTANPVVLWLAEQSFIGFPFPVDQIIIHSSNPVGADSMLGTLRRWGYSVRRQEAHFGV